MSVKISELTAWVAALAADEFPVSISGTTYKIALTSYFIPLTSAPVGAIVGLSDTQTLTNKTLTAPKIASGGFIADANGNELFKFTTTASAVNELTVANAATAGKPTITASGGDTNISINLVPKGSGTLQANAVDVVTVSGTQTLTNKTLTSPTLTTPALGTPSAGSLGSCTGYSVSNLANAGTGIITFLASGNSANLAGALADEVGYSAGAFAVFNIAPTIKLPIFADTTTPTKTVGFSISGATASTQTTLTFAQTVARTITFPDASDTLVGKATTDTLTNKTLTAPRFASGGFIADANGNEQIIFLTTASAVNEFSFTNAITGTSPVICSTGSSDTNIGFGLRTKGTGAFYFHSDAMTAPTSLGASAIDFQVYRSVAANSASGTQSACLGTYNGRASGANSLSVGGISAYATGTSSVVIGGYTNTASASYSLSIGGYVCTVSGAQGTVVGGHTNTVTATEGSIIGGKEAVANRIGMRAAAAGKFSVAGDNQYGRVIMRKATTDATQTELTLDGGAGADGAVAASNRFIVQSNTVVFADIYIVGVSTSNADRATYHRRVTLSNVAGTLSLADSQTIGTDHESNAAWDVAIDVVSAANDYMRVLVTGAAATNIRWMARVEFNELTSA